MKSNPITDWNAYASSHQAVMPSAMVALNTEAAAMMYDKVCDFGCGSAKILPFILNNEQVTAYTGIDFSSVMVEKARWMATQFPHKRSTIIESKIESAVIQPLADSAVSINSFYTWKAPEIVLQHIYACLIPGGVFVLATLNPQIDMQSLLESARVEQVANPYWQEFEAHNLAICESEDTNLVTLNDMVQMVRSVGFEVLDCHTRLYQGGLNYLVLKKSLAI